MGEKIEIRGWELLHRGTARMPRPEATQPAAAAAGYASNASRAVDANRGTRRT